MFSYKKSNLTIVAGCELEQRHSLVQSHIDELYLICHYRRVQDRSGVTRRRIALSRLQSRTRIVAACFCGVGPKCFEAVRTQ